MQFQNVHSNKVNFYHISFFSIVDVLIFPLSLFVYQTLYSEKHFPNCVLNRIMFHGKYFSKFISQDCSKLFLAEVCFMQGILQTLFLKMHTYQDIVFTIFSYPFFGLCHRTPVFSPSFCEFLLNISLAQYYITNRVYFSEYDFLVFLS